MIIASDHWAEDRDTVSGAFIPLIKNYLNNEKVTLIFFFFLMAHTKDEWPGFSYNDGGV